MQKHQSFKQLSSIKKCLHSGKMSTQSTCLARDETRNALAQDTHLIDMRSIFCSLTSMGTLPTACAASVWKNTLFLRHSSPISLQTIQTILETNTTSMRITCKKSAYTIKIQINTKYISQVRINNEITIKI